MLAFPTAHGSPPGHFPFTTPRKLAVTHHPPIFPPCEEILNGAIELKC